MKSNFTIVAPPTDLSDVISVLDLVTFSFIDDVFDLLSVTSDPPPPVHSHGDSCCPTRRSHQSPFDVLPVHPDTMLAPPPTLLRPLRVLEKLLTGPGPSNAPRRVLEAGCLPILGHLHAEFTQVGGPFQA